MGGGVSRQRKAPSTAAALSPPSSSVQLDPKIKRDAILNVKVATTDGGEDFRFGRSELQQGDVENEDDHVDYEEEEEQEENNFELDDDYENKLLAEDQGCSLSRTALSFDMDDNDLLFNLLYFNENPEGFSAANMGAICETAVTETLAAHSEGNTPYKLRPASEKVQAEFDGSAKLTEEIFNKIDSPECAICLDEMLIDSEIAYLNCAHCFHRECFLRWIKLQAFCPVCKTDIETKSTSPALNEEKKECDCSIPTAQVQILDKREKNGDMTATKQLHSNSVCT